jgi:hypothetical protein
MDSERDEVIRLLKEALIVHGARISDHADYNIRVIVDLD